MKKSVIRLIGVLAVLSMVIAMFASCGGGKAITVVGREDGSGTKSAFMEIIGLKGKADVEGIIAHSSTAAVLNEVKNNPNAIPTSNRRSGNSFPNFLSPVPSGIAAVIPTSFFCSFPRAAIVSEKTSV